jgi:hypothetical protein
MSIHTTIVSSSQIEEFPKLLGARAFGECLKALPVTTTNKFLEIMDDHLE